MVAVAKGEEGSGKLMVGDCADPVQRFPISCET